VEGSLLNIDQFATISEMSKEMCPGIYPFEESLISKNVRFCMQITASISCFDIVFHILHLFNCSMRIFFSTRYRTR
jgi:hypothetical protein